MYIFTNVASGNEVHKEAVMQELFPPLANDSESIMFKLLHSDDCRLRTAAVWALVNLTFPSSSGAFGRVMKLRNAGIVSQLKNMANDPCLDVKVNAIIWIKLLSDYFFAHQLKLCSIPLCSLERGRFWGNQ